MLRDHPWLVIMLSTVNAVALASLLAVYGAIEFVPGGSAPRVGRIILLGQMFIAGPDRLAALEYRSAGQPLSADVGSAIAHAITRSIADPLQGARPRLRKHRHGEAHQPESQEHGVR